MKTRNITIISVVFIFLAGSAWAACVPWKETEKHIYSTWSQKYPSEKVLEVESGGESTMYEKMVKTGKRVKDANGNEYEYLAKEIYCAQPANVSVRRASGTEGTFSMTWYYKQTGKKYVYSHYSVGEVADKARAGQEPPAKDDIKKMIADFWVKTVKQTDTVRKVLISKPEYKQYKDAWWYSFDADVYITDNEGKNKKCEHRAVFMFKGDKRNEGGKDPNAPWNFEGLGVFCRIER